MHNFFRYKYINESPKFRPVGIAANTIGIIENATKNKYSAILTIESLFHYLSSNECHDLSLNDKWITNCTILIFRYLNLHFQKKLVI